MENKRGGYVGGLILIVLGLLFLAVQYAPDLISGWMFLLGLGLVFLVGYILSRQYGLLIPGAILTGLAVGLSVTEAGLVTGIDEGGPITLGLGLGFVAIWLIDSLVVRGRPVGWWPLIPGGILVAVGAAILLQQENLLEQAGQWWPVILIIIGLLILIDRFRKPA